MMGKGVLFGVIMLFVVVGMFGLTSAQPKIDPEIDELLKTQKEVFVSITLKVELISNHSRSVKNPEERTKWLEDITGQVDEIQSEIIPNLSEEEFKVDTIFELSPSFSGNITKKGLEKLRNNTKIERIVQIEETYGGGNLKDQIIEDSLVCLRDSDCATISLACCGCNVASRNTPIEDLLSSINKDYLDSWNMNRENICQDAVCGQGVSQEQVQRCASHEPRCVNNLCTIVNTEEYMINDNSTITNENNTSINYTLASVIVFIIIILAIAIISKKRK